VPITEFVDTACPHNKNDHIRLRETKRFGKAVLGGGRHFADGKGSRKAGYEEGKDPRRGYVKFRPNSLHDCPYFLSDFFRIGVSTT
jgi:hypothetical protein